ncbi:alpha-D-ribose 1-methylphosphonate 5-triphosphate synthase subunit PhnH [Rhizobium sp. BK529]|uniref:phosphonate C-P lyase system protein PhnH n=1 Tax=unclassified Rhizobium TaxID=2613769 RepID=UPI00104A6CE7|nr:MULTISPECIES: phosphonate C-P lyase system protein PhnH [unclassified Rhizobium]MBB3593607.1 alpha-D-ribose 1-methylphosphonate 5-triphosphate synthase subunit PhnH [Rhizobium sp. BK529]TCS03395.1 alpha-D-ribose 1-methylphosphonate 5-triphosphate synthase subunit PhnH [Rhizobium sp. BK418]
MNQTLLLPTIEDMRTNATFDALMWALARPGRAQPLPFPGLLALAESLLDRECSFFCFDERLKAEIARTGANAVALPEAEYVFASLGGPAEISTLSVMLGGNLLYPDASATIFAEAQIGSGTMLRLTGPGVNGSIDIMIGGVHSDFWALRAEAIRYPLGWDIYLADGASLIGIPRSTKIEVL